MATLRMPHAAPTHSGKPRLAASSSIDLSRLISDLQGLLGPGPEPVPVEEWRARVTEVYRGKRRSTRTRMGQALREACQLAQEDAEREEGPGAVARTDRLTAALMARLAARPGRASTTTGLLSALRAACRLGAEWEYLDPSTLEGAVWEVPDRDPPRRRHHGRAEIARVLELLKAERTSWVGWRLHALAAVYAYTGLRLREALRLRLEDVDLVRGFIFVHGNGAALKTAGSEAPVPCPAALVAILREWLPRCRSSEWVFPGVTHRGPWVGGTTGRRATDRLVQAGLRAGVEGFTPQSLRHSLATHLRGYWGLSREQVRLVLRHTTEATQEHYVHPDLVTLETLVRKFDYGSPQPRSPRGPARGRRRRLVLRPRPMIRGRKAG